ncbi:DNA replication protein DnaD [Priestia taiwanensis]|uniref:Replication protein n=1 Tax=Priestia taiwanensis TaxID=1347902 RepID=A0A917EMW0_9BACI|nr:DNA replication protein DnaD [Priestia taiwanensis]MBM7361968.1 hypothetical protein [Priestia taiwanensis]GGE58410.1 hypothetical protein GCM10007140_05950 [Priestia taiwanensis]
MSRLLLNEQPLMVLPKLACKLGLNEAILLQQLHYWLQDSKNIRDGHKWVYNTYDAWILQFPFWSGSTLRRVMKRLEKEGYIITAKYNQMKIDNTKWYRIDYKRLERLDRPPVQNEQTECSEWADEQFELNKPLPEITSDIASSSSAREESGGVPSTVNEIPHSSEADVVDVIANKFIELRQSGLHLAPMDYSSIQEILANGITLENALKWLEECFVNYQPRHRRDKIRSVSYCVPYMLDRHVEITQASKAKTEREPAKYNEEDFDLDD